jgi:hypothetical protein
MGLKGGFTSASSRDREIINNRIFFFPKKTQERRKGGKTERRRRQEAEARKNGEGEQGMRVRRGEEAPNRRWDGYRGTNPTTLH